jgi:hypothetical protein
MKKWLADRSAATRPPRVADVSVIAPGGKVGDGLVDLRKREIVQWEWVAGRQPIVSSFLAKQDKEWVTDATISRSLWRSCKG